MKHAQSIAVTLDIRAMISARYMCLNGGLPQQYSTSHITTSYAVQPVGNYLPPSLSPVPIAIPAPDAG